MNSRDVVILTSNAIETLVKLIEDGPIWAGQLDKNGRDELLRWGLCTMIVHRAEDGWWAANCKGRDHYLGMFPNPDGRALNVAEAMANRQMKHLPDLFRIKKKSDAINLDGMLQFCSACMTGDCRSHRKE